MRKYLILSAVIGILLLSIPANVADGQGLTKSDIHRMMCSHHPHPASENRKLAKETFSFRNWRDPRPGKGAIRTSHNLRSCVKPGVRKKMARAWNSRKLKLVREHQYRSVATIPGWTDGSEGYYLRYLSVPKYVVECETKGYGLYPGSKGPRWIAHNPYGAEGPVQLLGWNNPWPVVTHSDYVAYWAEAAYVLAATGIGAWECA